MTPRTLDASLNVQEELGELLGSQADVVLVWGQQANGSYRYELRTRRTDLHVGELAKTFGGGGHQQAAGFISPHRI